jgi:hypothetical protein
MVRQKSREPDLCGDGTRVRMGLAREHDPSPCHRRKKSLFGYFFATVPAQGPRAGFAVFPRGHMLRPVPSRDAGRAEPLECASCEESEGRISGFLKLSELRYVPRMGAPRQRGAVHPGPTLSSTPDRVGQCIGNPNGGMLRESLGAKPRDRAVVGEKLTGEVLQSPVAPEVAQGDDRVSSDVESFRRVLDDPGDGTSASGFLQRADRVEEHAAVGIGERVDKEILVATRVQMAQEFDRGTADPDISITDMIDERLLEVVRQGDRGGATRQPRN